MPCQPKKYEKEVAQVIAQNQGKDAYQNQAYQNQNQAYQYQTGLGAQLQAISNSDKWWIAFGLALLFLIFASAFFLGLMNMYFCALGLPPAYYPGGVSLIGLIIAAIIFFFVVRILLC